MDRGKLVNRCPGHRSVERGRLQAGDGPATSGGYMNEAFDQLYSRQASTAASSSRESDHERQRQRHESR